MPDFFTDPSKARRMRVLIVEDHTPTRLAMSKLIRQAGALHGQPVQFLAKPFNLDVLLDLLGGKPN